MYWSPLGAAANPAIAVWLQSNALVGRVAELGSFDMKKKKLLLLVPLSSLLITGVILVRPSNVSRSVSVVFLGYTNCSFNERFICASFRLENNSPFMLACQQGPLDVECAGVWLQDTNRLGFQY